MSDDNTAALHVSNRRKRRRTLGTTWMDNVSNLPDLAALFDDGHRRAGSDVDGGAAALMESEENQALEPEEAGDAVGILGVVDGDAAAHISSTVHGGISNGKGTDHRETVVVEEIIDLIDYDEGPFPELGNPDYFDVESDGNGGLVGSDKVILPSLSQEVCEAMEGPPTLSSEDPGMGMGVDTRNVLRLPQLSRKLFEPWYNLLGFVTVCGSVRYTVKQYNLMRDILSWVAPSITFPSYSTVQRTLFPHALKYLFPKSNLKYFVVRRKKKAFNPTSLDVNPGGDEDTESQRTNGSKTPVRIVPPSEWAKLDIMMAPFFNSMYPESSRWCGGAADAECIEASQLVAERQIITEATRSLYVRNGACTVQAFPGAVIRLTLSELLPSSLSVDVCNLGYRVHENAANNFVMEGTIAAVWCVGSEGNVTRSAEMAMKVLRAGEKGLTRQLCTAPPLEKNNRSVRRRDGRIDFEARTRSSKEILPGDICTLLRPTGGEAVATSRLCLLVSRFWKHQDGLSSDILFWFERTSTTGTGQGFNDDSSGRPDTPFRLLGTQNLRGQPFLLRKHNVSGRTRNIDRRMQNSGRLMDGTKFVVYRVLLYCDDFSPFSSLYPQGSAGGCYMLPLGLPPRSRSTRSSVRIIGLTPPGVSTNNVLLSIIPDLVKCTTEGVEAHTPSGDKVRIFVDVVGFVADYPAAAETLDVMGHTANTPCTLCTFRKNTDVGQSGFGYTTKVNAHRTASLRCRERHEALRNSEIDNHDTNRLGMKDSDKINDESAPLLALQRELERVRADIPLTSDGKRVVSGRFEAYRCNVVAPDHLLAGLAKNLIEVGFHVINRQGDAAAFRTKADMAICGALRDNGLKKQSSVFSSKNELNSMTLSGVFCVLLVCVPVFKQLFPEPRSEETSEVLDLLTQLQKLVALTYWWPSEAADGVSDYVYATREDGVHYHADLLERAEKYVTAADKFCAKYCQGGGKGRASLDKPNLHRLLELYNHTIPAFGHVRHFMELVFENAHQPLKRSIVRGNHQRGHVAAVGHCLGNDWQGRLALLSSTMKQTSDAGLKMECKRGLRRLLVGEMCNELSQASEEWKDFLKETDVSISDVFVKPLMNEMRSDGKVNPAWTGDSVRWEGNGEKDVKELSSRCISETATMDASELMSELLSRAANILENLRPDFDTSKKSEVRFFSSARRVRRSYLSVYARTYSHDTIEPGCVVQVMLPRGGTKGLLLNANGGVGSSLNLFAVVGILQREDESPHAVVVRCRVDERKTLRISAELDSESVQVLSLTDGVRRVALYHACSDKSCPVSRDNSIKHSATVLSGGTFHFQTRREGYPARMA